MTGLFCPRVGLKLRGTIPVLYHLRALLTAAFLPYRLMEAVQSCQVMETLCVRVEMTDAVTLGMTLKQSSAKGSRLSHVLKAASVRAQVTIMFLLLRQGSSLVSKDTS